MKKIKFFAGKNYWKCEYVRPATFYVFSISKHWVHKLGDKYSLDIWGFTVGFWIYNKEQTE